MKKYKLYYEYGPVLKGYLIVTCPSVELAILYFGEYMGITEDDETYLTLAVSEYTFLNATIANGLSEISIFN